MLVSELVIAQTFGAALAKHYGLKHLMKVKLNTEREVVLSFTLDIAVTPDDLTAIAAIMKSGVVEVERKVMAEAREEGLS